jgi:hypothetical protein
MRVSYRSLEFPDVSICTVLVHYQLAHLVCSRPIEPDQSHKETQASTSLTNQSILPRRYRSRQVEVFHYFCIHFLLQVVPLVVGNRLVSGMFDGVLDNFLS